MPWPSLRGVTALKYLVPIRASSMPQWVYSWNGCGDPAVTTAGECAAGLSACPGGLLPHAARPLAAKARTIARLISPRELVCIAASAAGFVAWTRPRGQGFRPLFMSAGADMNSRTQIREVCALARPDFTPKVTLLVYWLMSGVAT